MKKFLVLILVSATVAVSGCTDRATGPKISSPDSVKIEGNTTENIEIQVKNTFKDKTASFRVNITSPAIVTPRDPGTRRKISSLEMGEAMAGRKTVKKVLSLEGNPEKLGSLETGTDQLILTAVAQVSGNLTRERRISRKNITVTVKK
ncbi:MAG: hypothetical protein ABEK10_04960 [Candidatus Nanosalina sp.]